MCLEVFYVEQQPPYSGLRRQLAGLRGAFNLHELPATVLVRFVTRGTTIRGLCRSVGTADQFPPGMIRPGDVIEINGTQFELRQIRTRQRCARSILDTDAYDHSESESRRRTILARPLNDSGQQINPKYDDNGREIGSAARPSSPYWTSPAPYKILRQPTPTSDEPYQLPEGTAIDLRASGVGSETITFTCQGINDNDRRRAHHVRAGRPGLAGHVQSNRRNRSTDAASTNRSSTTCSCSSAGAMNRRATGGDGDPTLNSSTSVAAATTDEERAEASKEPINWLSGDSRWIVIGSQTGRVVTIENAFVDPGARSANQSATSTLDEEMRTAQILAAREFTREMGQVGGKVGAISC